MSVFVGRISPSAILQRNSELALRLAFRDDVEPKARDLLALADGASAYPPYNPLRVHAR